MLLTIPELAYVSPTWVMVVTAILNSLIAIALAVSVGAFEEPAFRLANVILGFDQKHWSTQIPLFPVLAALTITIIVCYIVLYLSMLHIALGLGGR